MNGARQKRQALKSSPRRNEIPGAALCRNGLRSIPQSQRPWVAVTARHSPAIRWRQQRPPCGLFQIPAHAGMVFRGYRLKGAQRIRGVEANSRNQKGYAPKSSNVVCADLVVVRLVYGNGSAAKSVPAWRIHYPITVPKIARLTPSHGVAKRQIAPLDGVSGAATTPSNGAMRCYFGRSPTPSRGAYLDITIFGGAQWMS